MTQSSSLWELSDITTKVEQLVVWYGESKLEQPSLFKRKYYFTRNDGAGRSLHFTKEENVWQWFEESWDFLLL